jgi:hypothetical protein
MISFRRAGNPRPVRLRLLGALLCLLTAAGLLAGCSGPAFDDPEDQRIYEQIEAAFAARDWAALGTELSWTRMQQTDPVRKLAADTLSELRRAGDWSNAVALLVRMPFNFLNGGEYCASEGFLRWVAQPFIDRGDRFVKEPGQGGYYDLHPDELVAFVNLDELSGTEYVSTVHLRGDFALNLYWARDRDTGAALGDVTVALYLRGVCVSNVVEEAVSVSGDAYLNGLVSAGKFYGLDGYYPCCTGGSLAEGFSLIPFGGTGGGFCTLSPASPDYDGPQTAVR